MKRELPFLSPVSIIIAVFIFAVLGLSLWMNGGLGFSPGQVTAQARSNIQLQQYGSHAEFEKECQLCHQPLSVDQGVLCKDCHDDIAGQQAEGLGTHGSIEPSIPCAECHPEHKGRGFDPVAFAVSEFDHSQTGLSISGAHAALECKTCHGGENYQLTYQGCSGCHTEPRAHAGMYNQPCDVCHTDLHWQPAVLDSQPFDHNKTRFSLDYHSGLSAGQEVLCSDCHTSADGKANLQSCSDCHSGIDAVFMKGHQEMMGQDCLQCHTGTGSMANFDHNAYFMLDGRHSQLECTACHQDFHSTSPDCSTCHAEPEIHAGFFGFTCQYCHNTQAWTPAKLSQHMFALDHGGQGELECQSCHPDSYPGYTCYTCHDHTPQETASQHQEEGISAEDLVPCARCHPTGRPGEAETLQVQAGAQ